METLFHSKHSCGHDVYWSDPLIAAMTSDFPCAWCSQEVLADKRILFDPIMNVSCRQDAGSMSKYEEDEYVLIMHRADNQCCEEKEH